MNYSTVSAGQEDLERIIMYKKNSIFEGASLSDEEKKRIELFIDKKVPEQIDRYKIIMKDNRPIGCVLICECEDGFLLDELYIEKEHRGQGIGSHLIKEALLEYRPLHLWVYESNERAVSLYTRLGAKVSKKENGRLYMSWSSNEKTNKKVSKGNLCMNNKEMTRIAHNAIAQQYYKAYNDDTSDFEYIDHFLEKVKFKVLDLGCGMGQYSRYIKSKGYEVCGVDFSKGMLDIAREKSDGISFVESDVCELSDEIGNDFDGVLIAYVLQHLSKDETKRTLLNLHKYINKDCHLLILFAAGKGTVKEKEPFDETFEYVIKQYTVNEMRELLEECGYVVEEVVEKPNKYDENSLISKTMVLYAKNGE